MKILIISDSHGNISNIKSVMEIACQSKLDALIHAGDWNTPESVRTVLSYNIPTFAVLGNADIAFEVSERLKAKSKKFDENFLTLDLGGKKIGVTHKPSDNNIFFKENKHSTARNLDLIVNGHLHSAFEKKESQTKIVRPGALVNAINFAVYDTDLDEVNFVNEKLLSSS